jgi:hypothetical protein
VERDKEDLKKFEAMMIKWGFSSEGRDEHASKYPIDLNQLFAGWNRKNFSNPKKAVEALLKGEKIDEASASLFWYCYSSLGGFMGELQSMFWEFYYNQSEIDKLNKRSQEIATFKSQLTEIQKTFTLEQIKCPTGECPRITTLVGAALIILYSQNQKAHAKMKGLINELYRLVGQVPVGEPVGEGDYSLDIGLQPIETKVTNDYMKYQLSGCVSGFLANLACAVIWDSYANLAYETRDYRDSFFNCARTLDACWTTLADSCEDVEVSADNFFKLPYTNMVPDIEYVKKIIGIWEQVKPTLTKVKDWKEMGEDLGTFSQLIKRFYHIFPDEKPSGKIVIKFEDSALSEIVEYIDHEIDLCLFHVNNRGNNDEIFENSRKHLRETIMLKYFFPKGLHNYFEKGTLALLNDIEAEWQPNSGDKKFNSMANSMRKALEVEILATLPFLEFTGNTGGPHLLLTRIADAIINNEKEVDVSIDSLVESLPFTNKKQTKLQLKKQLPGFLKKVVDVRNFFDKEAYLPKVTKDELNKYKIKLNEVHRMFFGVGCEGMFPFLIELKKAKINHERIPAHIQEK